MRSLRVAVVAAVLAIAGSAQAFVRTHVDPQNADSPCLFWGRRTVPYQIVQRGTGSGDQTAVYDAIRTSLQQWTNVDCSDFTYSDQGFSQDLSVGYTKAVLNQPMLVRDVPPKNTILFRTQLCPNVVPAGDACSSADNDDCASVYDCWDYGDGVIALTTTTYSFQTGEIFDSDIELNAAQFTFTTYDPPTPTCPNFGVQGQGCISTDIRNTVTHESGHMLGLGHSTDPDATMYFSASHGETSKRDLASDDTTALCTIYPSGQPALTCNEPPASSSGCGCSTGAELALPLGLLLLFRRRMRK